ncbi:histone-lysine N-methyltransferase SUVR3 [Capsella rubella]|uniref:histone-lysine N-methyltransferase SUVR3 n=1 Tax=Capsella rubella TaxID=81985 RepID=UPI000CD597C5|nr:histone-lysine N-methyltransferase SUVR3 [Capsella rubella]
MQRESPPKKRRLGEEASDIIPATDLFLRCANLILPWLNSQELAAVSRTCKTLSLVSKSLTSHRSLDAARSFENIPIPFRNSVDSHPYAYFIYTPFQIPASSPPPRQWWGAAAGCGSESTRAYLDSVSERRRFGVSLVDESGEGMCGCQCERCEEGYCKCLAFAGMEEIANECGSGCGCGSDCSNRVTQKGISVGLKIVRDEKKGWCLYADQLIKQGQFICEYAGELLTTEEARKRQNVYDKLRSTQSFASALLVIREHLPSGQACLRINIDATRIGNIARFINHSCDGGNLSTVLLRSSGALLPRLCFFAARDIYAEEELSFSYGDVRVTGENRGNKLNCCCGSSCCFGTLPCENT